MTTNRGDGMCAVECGTSPRRDLPKVSLWTWKIIKRREV